jgi:hypothetical protein
MESSGRRRAIGKTFRSFEKLARRRAFVFFTSVIRRIIAPLRAQKFRQRCALSLFK